jgi:hypothetical protein
MDLFQPDSNVITGNATQQESLWLLGQPPLEKYLSFVKGFSIDGAAGNRFEQVQEWSAANDYCDELKKREAGIADMLDCRPLDPVLEPLAQELMADPRYRHAFDSLPTRIAMVEIGRMVVCQNHVNFSFIEQLKLRLGPSPDPQALFRFCLPLDDCRTPVKIREEGAGRYVFRCDSTDFRFHESIVLRPEQLRGYDSHGTIVGVAGVVLGFSLNFLNAIHDDDNGRLILNNGYHRACALLELGITHAPCVIQTVTRRDELDIVAKPVVAKDPGYFFNGARPPLLKDFADPRIRKLVPIKKVIRTIEVNFEIRDFFMQE